jgi:hypothetical protein
MMLIETGMSVLSTPTSPALGRRRADVGHRGCGMFRLFNLIQTTICDRRRETRLDLSRMERTAPAGPLPAGRPASVLQPTELAGWRVNGRCVAAAAQRGCGSVYRRGVHPGGAAQPGDGCAQLLPCGRAGAGGDVAATGPYVRGCRQVRTCRRCRCPCRARHSALGPAAAARAAPAVRSGLGHPARRTVRARAQSARTGRTVP